MGQGLEGRESQGLKHITAWTKSAAEKFWMRLRSSACMRLHLRAFAYVRIHLHACICAQKIKCLDASRRKKSLRPDTSFVQGLLGCTIPYESQTLAHEYYLFM